MKTLKETAEEMLPLQGNVRGEVLRNHAEYIKKKEGKEGLHNLEEKMKEIGAPIIFDEIKPFEWKSESLSALSVVVAKDIFDWTDEDLFEMGRFSIKISFIIKVVVRYLTSKEVFFKEIPKHWRKNLDVGEIEAVELNEKEKYMLLRLKEYKMHPLLCKLHIGYLKGISEFIIKSEDAHIEETKCIYNGDDYHEYKITWK